MKYVISSFTGDYPVERQPFWNQEYRRKDDAVKAARVQHSILDSKWEDLYTVVFEKDNDEVVEFIIYKGTEITNKIEATKLADSLYEENVR
jgi:hypothetical protein